jgi:hypothetical protein
MALILHARMRPLTSAILASTCSALSCSAALAQAPPTGPVPDPVVTIRSLPPVRTSPRPATRPIVVRWPEQPRYRTPVPPPPPPEAKAPGSRSGNTHRPGDGTQEGQREKPAVPPGNESERTPLSADRERHRAAAAPPAAKRRATHPVDPDRTGDREQLRAAAPPPARRRATRPAEPDRTGDREQLRAAAPPPAKRRATRPAEPDRTGDRERLRAAAAPPPAKRRATRPAEPDRDPRSVIRSALADAEGPAQRAGRERTHNARRGNRKGGASSADLSGEGEVTTARARSGDQEARAINLRGYRLILSSRAEEAERVLRAGLELEPTRRVRGMLLHNLGWSLIEQGKARAAVPLLRESAELTPYRPEPYERLAEAYRRLGRERDEWEALRRAAELRGEAAPAARRRASTGGADSQRELDP